MNGADALPVGRGEDLSSVRSRDDDSPGRGAGRWQRRVGPEQRMDVGFAVLLLRRCESCSLSLNGPRRDGAVAAAAAGGGARWWFERDDVIIHIHGRGCCCRCRWIKWTGTPAGWAGGNCFEKATRTPLNWWGGRRSQHSPARLRGHSGRVP